MTIEVRPLLKDRDEDEAFELLLRVDISAFGDEADPESLKADRALLELDRAVIAWDRDEPVGCSAIYSLNLSVPGGSVATAGVTWVGVVPTHRRRGVMSAMMKDRHDAIYEARAEPIAALWASQAPLYQRYGYGIAAHRLSTTVERRFGSMSRAPVDESLQLHIVNPADDSALTQPVYDRLRESRPGMPALDSRWHTYCIQDPKDEREGASKLQTVVVEGADGPVGYARYAVKHAWSEGYANGTVNLRQMAAVNPAASAKIWRYLLNLDLFERVSTWNMPSDHSIQLWLDEPRHAKPYKSDALYVRLIRIDEALRSRSYTTPIDVVIDVSDRLAPWNEGRWHLTADADGASCERSNRSADLSLDISMLGAIYLGATSLTELAAAGWVEEQRQGAVGHTSRAFSHSPAAWSPFVF
ncbi:MAG: GNAT family N-acetyltransferase [Candidatus Nanopelagicales bacterium]